MATVHFTYVANKIEAAKRMADGLASRVEHHGIEGTIREIATQECVEPFLTQSYQCGAGKVIDSLQKVSDQIDLVVYHRKVAPPILINQTLGLFPVECVRYIFEIKSRLTATEVKDANVKFRSIQKLLSFPRKEADGSVRGSALPATVLFAFGSDILGSELERYRKHTTDTYPPCTVLCVLGKGYWFYDSRRKNWYGREASPELPLYGEFCDFITGFMNTLASEETSMKPFRPGTYMAIEDTVFTPI